MATYQELFDLRADSPLRNRVTIGVIVKAQALIDGVPAASKIAWAEDALKNPVGKGTEILHYILAVNKSLTVGNIQGQADTAIQTNVDTAVDALIAGGA